MTAALNDMKTMLEFTAHRQPIETSQQIIKDFCKISAGLFQSVGKIFLGRIIGH